MKKWVSVLAVIFVVVTGLYLYFNPAKNGAPTPADSAANISSAAQINPASVPAILSADASSNSLASSSTELANRAGVAAPTAATAENIPAAAMLENIGHAVRQYGTMFGGNPVGNNSEITAALNGGNPKQVNFIRPEAGMKINGNGELVDAWGTPLFFHQLSGSETEVRSAGPDKIMWTPDDLVAK